MQAIGRSRGRWTTKVHALTDVIGRPYALMLTPGNVADVKAAPERLARMGRARYVVADKGYDADPLRRRAGSSTANHPDGHPQLHRVPDSPPRRGRYRGSWASNSINDHVACMPQSARIGAAQQFAA